MWRREQDDDGRGRRRRRGRVGHRGRVGRRGRRRERRGWRERGKPRGTSGAAGAAGTVTGAGGAAGAGGPGVDAATEGGVSDGGADVGMLPVGTGCAGTGTLCWDFEEGKLPAGWTPYRNEYTTGSLLVDGTRPHRGTYALHAKDFSGGTEAAQGGPKHTMRFALPAGFGPVLWGRAWVYMSPGVPMSHAGFFNARYPAPNVSATSIDVPSLDWYEVATSGGKYVSIYHPPEPPGTPESVQISDTPGVVGNWACIEWLFDAHAAPAADPRVWVGGAELAWPTKEVSPADAGAPRHDQARDFTVLESGIYLYQGLTTVTNWWIDDLAVGPERIGCD